MVYKFSILNDDNKEKIFYLSADNASQLKRRVLSTYGALPDKITILEEYAENDDWTLTLKKSNEKIKKFSKKVTDKTDEIYSKLTRRCEPYKTEYINKYSFIEVPITGKADVYPLVEKYKRVKVYFETGERRGTKKLYALVKN